MVDDITLPFIDFQISWFGIMMVVAFVATNIFLRRYVTEAGYEEALADDITFRAALGGIIGAKLYFIIELSITDWAAFVWHMEAIYNILLGLLTFFTADGLALLKEGLRTLGTGMVFLGGFCGGALNVYMLIRKRGIGWLEICDIAAPLVALGHGIGRIGCLLVGDDYGVRTDSFLGMTFPYAKPPFGSVFSDVIKGETVYVFPTQIFEMVIYFSIFLYLRHAVVGLGLYKFKGQIICEFLFLHGLGRFLVEFIRTNPDVLLGLSGAQLISLVMMVSGTIVLYLKNRERIALDTHAIG